MGPMWGPTGIPWIGVIHLSGMCLVPSYASFTKMLQGLAHQKPLVAEEMEGRAPIPLFILWHRLRLTWAKSELFPHLSHGCNQHPPHNIVRTKKSAQTFGISPNRVSFPKATVAVDNLSEVLTAPQAQNPFRYCLHYYKKNNKDRQTHGQKPVKDVGLKGLGHKEREWARGSLENHPSLGWGKGEATRRSHLRAPSWDHGPTATNWIFQEKLEIPAWRIFQCWLQCKHFRKSMSQTKPACGCVWPTAPWLRMPARSQ